MAIVQTGAFSFWYQLRSFLQGILAEILQNAKFHLAVTLRPKELTIQTLY